MVLATGVETSQQKLNRDGAKLFLLIRNSTRPALSYPQGHGSFVMSTWTPSIVPRGYDETTNHYDAYIESMFPSELKAAAE